jgi:cyanophycinase
MQLTEARGRLIAIGGAEDREGDRLILKEFIKQSGGNNAHIVVMTAATDKPEEVGQEYTKIFKDLGAKKAQVIDVSNRADALAEENVEIIKRATGLFFTGGDQLHITSLLGGTPLQRTIHEQYEKDLLVAGTSAGAAMMSNSMILDGDSDESPRMGYVEMAAGMDLIVGCIIDTHFSQRGRHGRLLTAVAHYPQDVGFGVDENTAFFVKDNKFTVIGEGSVTVIDGGGMTYTNAPYIEKGKTLSMADVKVHVLSEGHKFDLRERRVLIPAKGQHKVKRAGVNENTKSE